ncbi:MAG: 7TM domain-containing protein [Bacteroidota bacterium]
MKGITTSRIIATSMIMIPLVLIIVRLWSNQHHVFEPGHQYDVNYQFEIGKSDDEYQIKTYLPLSNERQRVSLKNQNNSNRGTIMIRNGNKVIEWKSSNSNEDSIDVNFEFIGEARQYEIDPAIRLDELPREELKSFLRPTEYIQSDDSIIITKAQQLASDKATIKEIVGSFYEYVFNMPSAQTSALTDAVTALHLNRASCNGKSRLLVAFCRSVGIPARVAGGLILEETSKKTSHLWAEISIGDHWVPFDALNGHFAEIPANYLELYKGDQFLITRSKNIAFDYTYVIDKTRINHFPNFALFDIWEIIDEAAIPAEMIKILLLLPLGAFLVSVFNNIIGIKTYGLFLPVLISFAFFNAGVIPGVILFSVMIAVVAAINYPLEKGGIQYNSKIAIMLIAVVVTALAVINLLHKTQWLNASIPLFFPIIILTIVSERFARKTEEEGVGQALNLYLSTLLVTLVIYYILSAETIQNFIMTFPEIICSLAGLNILLGKWIGLRVTEYYRFYKVTSK